MHPATKHDDPVVTLHSLLDRDVYRGGAIVVGPVRRGRGRRLRVERRVLPVTADENRRIEVFERELWRIAVEHLDYGEQIQWAALAGARVAPTGWRRARAMLHFDQSGELKRTFLLTALQRNKNPQLRVKALQEIAQSRDDEAFDEAVEVVGGWPRDDRREGVKVLLLALAERKLGRRDQANNWIWRLAEYTRELHEEYAVQRWPETKRLLGLLVNSSGGAHARNARRLVQAARQQDRRLAAALLAAALPHTAEAGEVINGARMRMSRKPGALARELLRNLPKGKAKRRRKKKKGAAGEAGQVAAGVAADGQVLDDEVERVLDLDPDHDEAEDLEEEDLELVAAGDGDDDAAGEDAGEPAEPRVLGTTAAPRRVVIEDPDEARPARGRRRSRKPAAEPAPARSRRSRKRKPAAAPAEAEVDAALDAVSEPAAAEATPPRASRAPAGASPRPRRPPPSRSWRRPRLPRCSWRPRPSPGRRASASRPRAPRPRCWRPRPPRSRRRRRPPRRPHRRRRRRPRPSRVRRASASRPPGRPRRRSRPPRSRRPRSRRPKKPAAKKPAAKRPAAKKPAAKKPAAERAAAKKPAAKRSRPPSPRPPSRPTAASPLRSRGAPGPASRPRRRPRPKPPDLTGAPARPTG